MDAERRRAAALLRDVTYDRPVTGPQFGPGVSRHVVELAAWHGIVSLVRGSELRPRLTSDAAAVLEQHRLREQARRMVALQDMRVLGEALGGLSWAVVKGPVLSELVYRERGRRSFSDLDVLVDPARLGEALDALEAHGVQLLDRNFALALRQGRGELSLRLPGGSVLDLHWHLINDAVARGELGLATGPLLSRSREVELAGVPARALDAVDAAVHVLVHATMSGGHRLLWVRDARESMTGLPVQQVLARAHEAGCTPPVRVMLRRAGLHAGRSRSLWEGAHALLAPLLPPGRPPEARPTGVGLVGATRGSTLTSVTAMLRHRREKGAWHRSVGPGELAQPVDEGSRAGFLAYAAAGGTGRS